MVQTEQSQKKQTGYQNVDVAVLPPLVFNYFRSLDPPDDRTVRRLWLELKMKMFCGGKYCYHLDDVAALLDIISSQDKKGRHNAALNPENIPWGQVLLSAVSIKDNMSGIGVRGSNEQFNAKKVVGASCAKLDSNNAVKNKLLKAVLPHKSKTAKPNSWRAV